jgi:hypothetical protein
MTQNASTTPVTAKIPCIDDIDAIISVLSRVFQKEFTREYIANKYFHNPSGSCPIALVMAGTECVAFSGLVPVYYYQNGKKMKAALEADLAILESHRNLEVLLKLISLLKEQVSREGILFSYSVTNADTASVMRVVWGKTFVAPVPVLVKVLTYETALKDATPGAPVLRIMLRAVSLLAKALFYLKGKSLSETSITTPDKLAQPFDVFDGRQPADDPRIRFSKDGAYLAWRYGGLPPGNPVHVLTAKRKSEQLCAVSIVNVVLAKGLKRGRIYDLYVLDPMTAHEKHDFVHGVVRWFYSQKCDRIDCWNFTQDPLHPYLRKAGLTPRPKDELQISYMIHDSVMGKELDTLLRRAENWSFSLGDTDMI